MPDPATRSLTVLDTRISPDVALAATWAPNLNRNPAHLVSNHVTFACVQAGFDLDAKQTSRVVDAAGRSDRAGWSVEGRQEPILSCLDLMTSELLKLSPYELVM